MVRRLLGIRTHINLYEGARLWLAFEGPTARTKFYGAHGLDLLLYIIYPRTCD